jgi:hypothetical protein
MVNRTVARVKGALLFSFFSLIFSLSAHGDGLSTPFADVRVKNVIVGKSYDVPGPLGNGLPIQNTTDMLTRVQVVVLVPALSQLKEGATPIPETSWIEVVPNQFDVLAHHEAACQIRIRVPANDLYRHKTYQVMLWSRTLPVNGEKVVMSAGLLSRLRFETK